LGGDIHLAWMHLWVWLRLFVSVTRAVGFEK